MWGWGVYLAVQYGHQYRHIMYAYSWTSILKDGKDLLYKVAWGCSSYVSYFKGIRLGARKFVPVIENESYGSFSYWGSTVFALFTLFCTFLSTCMSVYVSFIHLIAKASMYLYLIRKKLSRKKVTNFFSKWPLEWPSVIPLEMHILSLSYTHLRFLIAWSTATRKT